MAIVTATDSVPEGTSVYDTLSTRTITRALSDAGTCTQPQAAAIAMIALEPIPLTIIVTPAASRPGARLAAQVSVNSGADVLLS